ncbi:mucin-like protein [Stylophora pistillata]|uniref:mucin-like protein n=1 Tax=Stylophora pistillata TaxID=50429 RepID=UPI000C04A468|nr:mucin-like protein [Stylophora pistillata]
MQRCTNYPGGRNCSCFEGFQISQTDDTACTPIASCNVSQAGCQQVCVEEQGKPKCSCHKGYQLKGDSKTCSDIDECSTHRHRCSQNCFFNEGSYTCSCAGGYNLESDYRTCSDIDECGLIDVVYCANPLEFCINTIGSFYCECQQGYQRINNTCEEIYPKTGKLFFTESPATNPGITDQALEEASDNAVVMTIRNTDISEVFFIYYLVLITISLQCYCNRWVFEVFRAKNGISQLFEDIVSQVVVKYCQEDDNENCRHSKLRKRSISAGILDFFLHMLKNYPQQEIKKATS